MATLPLPAEQPPPTRAWQIALLVPLVAAYAALVWSPGYRPDPDSYYHVGCARLYAGRGWLASFPWLPYTVLGPEFTNVHLLQHLALAPVVGWLSPALGLRAAPVVLSSALAVSVFLVLRRWAVPSAGAYAVLGLLSAPILIIYATSVKGGGLFFVLFVWFVDAVWSRSARRVFVLAWVSAYTYVGAPILLAVAAAPAVVSLRRGERGWARLILLTAAGLAAGLVVNPFWPGHLAHTARELLSTVWAPAALTPGVFRGGEWMPLSAPALLWLAGAPAAAWAVLVVRQVPRSQRLPAASAWGLLLSLALLGLALAGGTKLLHLFALASALFVPLMASATGPWPRAVVPAAAVLAAANAGWSLHRAGQVVTASPGPLPADYQSAAVWLAERTSAGELVVAPWDDFPGLFLYEPGRRYVAGINLEFLLRADPARFGAYYRLYAGQHPDPGQALAMFGQARFVLARLPRLDPAGGGLVQQLARDPRFEAAGAPAPAWVVFRRR